MGELHYRIVRDLMVAVHTTKRPTDAEWSDYLAAVARPTLRGVLAWTAGGAPDAGQRTSLMKVYSRDRPVAVVTDAPLTRAILSVASLLFFTQAKAFSFGREDDALTFLGVSESERAELQEALRALRAQAGV